MTIMNKLFTLFSILFLTFSFSQQQVTVGTQGTGLYFKSQENVYITNIKIRFENDVQLGRTSAFEQYWVPLLIDPNDFSLSWSASSGTGDDSVQMLLSGNSVNAAFKPTNNEFKQLYEFAAENTLVTIVEVAGFVSTDGSTPAPDDLVQLTFDLDNTLSFDKVAFDQVLPYPNPFNDVINISGLKEVAQATVFDLTGREVFRCDITPTNNTLNVNFLTNSIYFLNIDNGISSKAYTMFKR